MRGWFGEGEPELADDTGLARSAYMSSESALRTELLLEEADEAEETLLTLSDLEAREEGDGKLKDAGLDVFQSDAFQTKTAVPGFPCRSSDDTRRHRKLRQRKKL